MEKEIREASPFTIATNNIKCLGVTLTKKVKHLYYKNFEFLKKKIHTKLKKLVSKTPNNPIKKWGTELNRQFSIEETKMAERHRRKK